MINYVQLTSQTALFKCHHRILLGMCLLTEATGLHIQEAAHSLNAPFSAFVTVHSSSLPSWTAFQTLRLFPLCFPSVTITYSMLLHRLSLHGTCHSFPPSSPPLAFDSSNTVVIVRDKKKGKKKKKAFDIKIPSCSNTAETY